MYDLRFDYPGKLRQQVAKFSGPSKKGIYGIEHREEVREYGESIPFSEGSDFPAALPPMEIRGSQIVNPKS